MTILKEGKVRNLTKTLAVVSLLAPASAHPLGIGGIKLHSALNQNLNAEIALVLSAGENASDIKVNLAPPDKFDEAGVPWSSFLSKIKFERSGAVIKLSSREALKEPFLDFLLEVSWPKGTVYRQFTVLVDPPATYRQATIPVATPTQSYQSVSDYAPPREPSSRPRARTPSNANEYVTRSSDTLWKVAQQTNRHEDVSVEQMMIALYNANPRAFYKENVNALMAGKTLKIPEKEIIVKLSRKQALSEFNRQTAVWKSPEIPTPVETITVPEQQPPIKEVDAENQLTLAAPTESEVTDKTLITPGTEQAAGENKSVAEKTGAETEQATSTPDKVSEEGSNVSEADKAMQNRLAALETQLAEMQKMLALKDQQLSALQNQIQIAPTGTTGPIPQLTTTDKIDASQPQQPIIQPEVKPQPKAIEPIPVQPEPSSDSVYYMTIGGAGIGILSLLGWLWWRKRKIEDETNAESMFASSMLHIKQASDSFAASNVNPPTSYGVEAVGESSFLSEFTPSDFDAFDTSQNEIDPISEADVYLAYGRYQQAEDLIRQAIKDQPERDECKLKLLEIFYANENKTAFETYAKELAVAGKQEQSDFWEKVAEMGDELCPDSALFSGSASNKAVKDDADIDNIFGSAEFDLRDTERDSSIDESNQPSPDAPIEEDANKDAVEIKKYEPNFDLSSFEAEDESDSGEVRNNENIDFDLESFQSDSIVSDAATPSVAAENNAHDEFESFKFEMPSSQKESKENSGLDLSGEESSFGTVDSQDDNTFDLSTDFDIDFNFDFDIPDASDKPAADEGSTESGFSDLTDMDEYETKLDLAKAYIDMGDEGSAKSIVEEVLINGNEEQKKTAQTILDELK